MVSSWTRDDLAALKRVAALYPTQVAAATALGVGEWQLSRWLHGKYSPSNPLAIAELRQRIAGLLGGKKKKTS